MKLTFKKFFFFFKLPKIQILEKTLHVTHLELLDKMCKFEMDPTKTVGATERTWDAEETDARSETNITPPTSLCGSIKNVFTLKPMLSI